MSGPVQPPFAVQTTTKTTVVRPTSTLSLNADQFTVTNSGSRVATVSIIDGGGGIGGSITEGQVAFGAATADEIEGSSKLTWNDSSELLMITCSDNTDTLVIKSTDTDANVGPIFTLFRDDGATPTANDVLGRVMFKADNSVTATTTYAEITGICNSPTDGSEHGWMNLGVMTNGTVDTDYITLRGDAAQVCVNEGAADIDFRIEGQGEANLFRTNAVTKNIGIGEAPSSDVERLHITGTGADATTVRIESTEALGDAGPILELYRNATGADDKDLGGILFAGNDDGDTKHTFAEIRTYLRDTGAGGEDSVVIFYATQFGGDRTEFIRYGLDTAESQREVVINDGSSSAIDFRVETNNLSNAIRTSASQDNVGIGASPGTDAERLHVKGGGLTAPMVLIESEDDPGTTSSNPVLRLYNSSTPGTNRKGGEIEFSGKDDDGNAFVYGSIGMTIRDSTATEDGSLEFYVGMGGSSQEYIRVGTASQQILLNPGGTNIDTVVRSETQKFVYISALTANTHFAIGFDGEGTSQSSGGAQFQVDEDASFLLPVAAYTANHDITAVQAHGYALQMKTGSGTGTFTLPASAEVGMHVTCINFGAGMNVAVDSSSSDKINGGGSAGNSTTATVTAAGARYDLVYIAADTWNCTAPAVVTAS
jgi:hypothetical protein